MPKFSYEPESEVKKYIYPAIFTALLCLAGILLARTNLPPKVPLLYGQPAGEGQLVPTLGLLVAPGVSLAIILINTVVGFFIKDKFLKKALAVSALFMSILTTITVLKIIFLVGSF